MVSPFTRIPKNVLFVPFTCKAVEVMPWQDNVDAEVNAPDNVVVPACDSTGSRVPILPGTDSTGSYRVLLLYTTVRL